MMTLAPLLTASLMAPERIEVALAGGAPHLDGQTSGTWSPSQFSAGCGATGPTRCDFPPASCKNSGTAPCPALLGVERRAARPDIDVLQRERLALPFPVRQRRGADVERDVAGSDALALCSTRSLSIRRLTRSPRLFSLASSSYASRILLRANGCSSPRKMSPMRALGFFSSFRAEDMMMSWQASTGSTVCCETSPLTKANSFHLGIVRVGLPCCSPRMKADRSRQG